MPGIAGIHSKEPMQDNQTESEKRFNELAELLPAAIVETNLQGNLIFVSDTGCRMLGYSQDELLGQPFFRFFAPEERSRVVATARSVMAGKFPGDNEFTLVKKDGSLISTFIQSVPVKTARVNGAA
jgi:PAS domain S-box-containing protein